MLLGHEKISFLHLPTPLERLDNISDALGINLFIKRDDLIPLAADDNKLRKLEYFLKDKICDYFDLEALKAEAPEDAPDVTEEYERGAYNNPCREIREAMYYMAENGQK